MSREMLAVLDTVARVLIVGVVGGCAFIWWRGLRPSGSHRGNTSSVERKAIMDTGTANRVELVRLLDLAVSVKHGDAGDLKLDNCEMWAYSPLEGWRRFRSGGDVYAMLRTVEEAAQELAWVDAPFIDGATAIGCVSSGWAAPSGEGGTPECAPSEHRERVRVRLSMCGDVFGVSSMIRFADSRDAVVDESGEASGSLNDAFEAVRRLVLVGARGGALEG